MVEAQLTSRTRSPAGAGGPSETASPPTPLPGRPVRGSRTGRPLMAALDLLGRRWTLRIVWELSHGATGFRDLQARCDGMSASVLATRLRDLQDAALAEPAPEGWALTALGHDLVGALGPLNSWSERWAGQLPSDGK